MIKIARTTSHSPSAVPRPVPAWSQESKDQLLPLLFVFSIAWAFEMCVPLHTGAPLAHPYQRDTPRRTHVLALPPPSRTPQARLVPQLGVSHLVFRYALLPSPFPQFPSPSSLGSTTAIVGLPMTTLAARRDLDLVRLSRIQTRRNRLLTRPPLSALHGSSSWEPSRVQ